MSVINNTCTKIDNGQYELCEWLAILVTASPIHKLVMLSTVIVAPIPDYLYTPVLHLQHFHLNQLALGLMRCSISLRYAFTHICL